MLIHIGTGGVLGGSSTGTISFEEKFRKIVDERTNIIVIVTPIGEPVQISVTQVNSNGFSVKCSEKSQVSFYYIAIGKRKIKSEIPEEILARDFDDNMEKFAFNESKMKENALGMWWDGSSLRWGSPPEPPPAPKIEGVLRCEAKGSATLRVCDKLTARIKAVESLSAKMEKEKKGIIESR